MSVSIILVLWVAAAVIDGAVLAKFGLAYLRLCIPVLISHVGNSQGAIRAKLPWLIPIESLEISNGEYLLRESYKIRFRISYPILCYGHQKIYKDSSKIWIRIRWSTVLFLPWLMINMEGVEIILAFSLVFLSAFVIQCVRFGNEAKRNVSSLRGA